MLIHKSHSKNDLIDLINDLELKVVFSHQDNKKSIQTKLIDYIMKNKIHRLKQNYYRIQNKDGLIYYLQNNNPKKILSIKEKKDLMIITKHIINYCKNDYDLDCSRYKNIRELEDDMDYIKRFGDIPSCRRACKLMDEDPKFNKSFKPYLSPQLQKEMEQFIVFKKKDMTALKINRLPNGEKFKLYFD